MISYGIVKEEEKVAKIDYIIVYGDMFQMISYGIVKEEEKVAKIDYIIVYGG